MKKLETFYGMDKYYEKHLDFEKPKYIYVDRRKVEIEEIIIEHTKIYGYDKNLNRICEEFKHKMWKLKKEILLDTSKYCVVNDEGKIYTCYLSKNRKTLIEN